LSYQLKSYLLSFVIVAATALLLVKTGRLIGYMEQKGIIRADFGFYSQPQEHNYVQPAAETDENMTSEEVYSWELPDPDMEEKQRHLQLLSAEIDLKLEQMQQAEENLQRLMLKQPENKVDNVIRLADLYAKMPDTEAARIFEALDDDMVALLLQKMEVGKASAIMALLSLEKAKSVTARMIADNTREQQ